MIATWILYASLMGLLVGAATLALERGLHALRLPLRGLWAAALAVSLAFPLAATLASSATHAAAYQRLEREAADWVSMSSAVEHGIVKRPAAPAGDHIEGFVRRLQAQLRNWMSSSPQPAVETAAAWLAASSSLGLLGVCLLSAWRLRRESLGWPQKHLSGQTVLVAPATGPAVLGLLCPKIVLPRWLLSASAATRDASLAHEREHIAAHDPQLWFAALGLLVLMPWNAALWWQLRRLRLAIELDCDRRVLRTGADAHSYAQELLNVYSASVPRRPLAGVALAFWIGWPSQLERRIRAMLMERPRYRTVLLAGSLLAAAPLLAVAVQLPAPQMTSGMVASPTSASGPKVHLGVTIADADPNPPPSIANSDLAGAIILYVAPGSVADHAGLRVGDTIVRFGARNVRDTAALTGAVSMTVPGAQVHLLVRRGPDELDLTADFAQPITSSATSVGSGAASGSVTERSDSAGVGRAQWMPPAVKAAGGDPDALRDAQLPLSQPQLRTELIRMSGLQQLEYWIQQLPKAPPPASRNTANAPVLVVFRSQAQPFVDAGSARNVRELKQIIAHYGWPTVSMVGYQGAHAAALIAQQATGDPEFQSDALQLMEPLFSADQVRAIDYAVLYDIVHSPQRFGTEVRCVDGHWQPSKPVEDLQHLAARRARVGLPSSTYVGATCTNITR